jgi:CRP/FNR family cyclic AMP-dependent transcriptional regulator
MIDLNRLLTKGATYKKVVPNELIFCEGEQCNYYYQLVSGRVKWINIDEMGRECIHSMVEPGESFGEFPLFDNGLYAASAIAEEESILIRLYKPLFLELLKDDNELLFAFTSLLTKRLRFKYSLIKSFGAHTPEVRIKCLIDNLRANNKNFCQDCNQLKLTRQQIADMSGLRVETVIRAMRNMHEKGEIRINRGKVFCKDMTEVINT